MGDTHKGATLKGATLKGATLKGATLKVATLKGATLKRAPDDPTLPPSWPQMTPHVITSTYCVGQPLGEGGGG